MVAAVTGWRRDNNKSDPGISRFPAARGNA